jgi:hypothetical protein
MNMREFFAQERSQVAAQRWAELLARSEKKNPTRRRKRAHEAEPGVRAINIVEVIDVETLKRVHARRAELLPDQKAAHTLFDNFYAQTLAANGRRIVHYEQKLNGENFGRYYARNGASLQGMWKPLRATLARDLYWQLDICNAHPWILLSLAQNAGWAAPKLEHYVTHREAVLESFSVGRDEAKTAMLMLMYGGNAERRIGQPLPQFVVEFRAELVLLAQRLYAANPDTVKRLKIDESDNHKKYYTFMSRVLQDRESACMLAAIDFMASAGWQTGALLHDGILVLKRTDAPAPPDAALLHRLTESIAQRCEIRNIAFQVKEFGDSLLDGE